MPRAWFNSVSFTEQRRHEKRRGHLRHCLEVATRWKRPDAGRSSRVGAGFRWDRRDRRDPGLRPRRGGGQRTRRLQPGLVACSSLVVIAPAHGQVRARSTQIALSPQASSTEDNPVLASDGKGRFVALWSGRDPAIPGPVLRLRRVRKDGKALEAKTVAVPLPPPAFTLQHALAFSPSGTIAAAWIECEDVLDSRESIARLWVKIWDRQLRVTHEAAVVNLTEATAMHDPSLAYLPDGTLMIAWGAVPADGALPFRSSVRLFDSNGRATTPELRIGSDEEAKAVAVSVAVGDGSPEFVATWAEKPDPASPWLIYIARFSETGELVGGPTKLEELAGAAFLHAAVQANVAL
ncbi:MAG: hypothetical protein ACI8TX_000830 [Hyphomicrobiaceae bacterium]